MTTLRETDSFKAVQLQDGRVYISTKMHRYEPAGRRVSRKLWSELSKFMDAAFDMSCMFDLGIGVFEKGATT